jgi:dihydrolipoamide dehydrogenase
MKKYDVIVIGSGCGMNIVEEALGHGMSVALVDKGPLGGPAPIWVPTVPRCSFRS